MARRALVSFTCAVGTALAGLLWRSGGLALPPLLAKHGGDALWALMVFFLCSGLLPKARLTVVTAWALGFSYFIELSQLYHAPWIDSTRATFLGHLVLGSTFNWPDFLSYTFGVGAGFLLGWLASTAMERGTRDKNLMGKRK